MADIVIEREHGMDLAQARALAFQWAEQAEEKFDMVCTYEENANGQTQDEVCFSRAGVTGTLTVTPQRFELHAKLGFLLSAFKDRIETEIGRNLDELMAKAPVPPVEAIAAAVTRRPAAASAKQT